MKRQTNEKTLLVLAIRILIAFTALLPLAWKKGFRLHNLFTKRSFLYGIYGYGGNLVLLTLGLKTCTANISAIIHGLFPVFMIILGYTMLNEAVTKNKVLGIMFSVVGVIIVSIGDLSQNSGTTIIGILLVTISVLTWAYYSVYAKKTAEGMDTFVLSEICFGTGFLCVLPFTILEQFFVTFSMPEPKALVSLLYLGIMSGMVGILLWNYGLKKVDSTVSGIYFNLMPVIGLFFAILTHERIAFLQVFGCILILIGVAVCAKQDKYKKYL